MSRLKHAKYYPISFIFDKVITETKQFHFFMIHSVVNIWVRYSEGPLLTNPNHISIPHPNLFFWIADLRNSGPLPYLKPLKTIVAHHQTNIYDRHFALVVQEIIITNSDDDVSRVVR